MKKLLIMVFCFALVFGIAACGNSKTENNDKAGNTSNAANEKTDAKKEETKKQDTIVMRAGSANNKENMFTQIEYSFAEKIEKATDGRIKVEVYPDAVLGKDKDLIEGMTLGTVDMVVNASALYANYNPLMGILDIPFLFRDYDHVHKALDGEVGDALKQGVLEKSGLRILGFPDGLFRFMYLKNPIDSVDGLKGLKIRSPEAPTYINMLTALGASPTPMPWNDIYTSIKTGVIVGAEGPVDGAYQANFHEVVKALVKTRHIYSPTTITIRDSLFSKLSKEDQELVQKTAIEVIEEFRTKIKAIEDDYTNKFKDAGVQIIELDTAAFQEKTKAMPEQFIQENGGKELIDKLVNTK